MGAAAGVTATVGVSGETIAAAGATLLSGIGPEYLRRSTYVDLVGERFTAAGHDLRLLEVGDVLGASFDPDLVAHEMAFALLFDGPADLLPGSIYELGHPLIGPFALFVSPAGAARGTRQSYSVIVDRTVRLKDVPREAEDVAPVAQPPRREPAKDDPPPSAPTERDVEVVAERVEQAREIVRRRRRRARRAHRKLRQTHARRVSFKRKQRARMRTARTGWLRRHGR